MPNKSKHLKLSALAVTAALASTLVCAPQAGAVVLFGQEFQLNGGAIATPSSVQLTTAGVFNQRGSAILKTPIVLDSSTSIKMQFSFRILGGSDGADGFTFLLHNDSRGAGFLGLEGGNLGFYTIAGGDGNPLPFGPAIAISFDNFQNFNYGDADNNHVGILDNTTYQVRKQVPAPFDLNSGELYFATIDYSAATDVLGVYLSDDPTNAGSVLLEFPVDLAAYLGGQAYLGFTAANGGLTNDHIIESFSPQVGIPEPSTVALLGLGLAGFLLRGRFSKRHVGTIP